MRTLFILIIMCFTVQSAHADSIYTFMQFACDETNNTIGIKRVYATDYPEFTSLDDVPGVLREDLGVEYTQTENGSVLKPGQLPKTVRSCNLKFSEKEKIEISLSLSEVHTGRLRGLCAAASGPAYEVLLNKKVIARFQSDKDRCFLKLNPLDIVRMEYSWGGIKLCRSPDISRSNIQSLNVLWEGELCLSGTPERILETQDVMKDFEKKLFDSISLEEAKRELHIYRNTRLTPDHLEREKQNHQHDLDQLKLKQENLQEKISGLEVELEETKSNLAAEKSKTIWQRLFD